MKKVLLSVAVLGTIFLSGCEKDEAVSPADRSSIKADDVIMCAGCGQWDINSSDSDASSYRMAAPVIDTESTPKRPAKPGKKK